MQRNHKQENAHRKLDLLPHPHLPALIGAAITNNKACINLTLGIELWVEPGVGVVPHNFHHYTRQAARESLAAKKALTDNAEQRHLALAGHFVARAQQLQNDCSTSG